MNNNRDTEKQLDMIDAQLCALLAKREELAGGRSAPDRRRLAAVRKIGRQFGQNVAEAYKRILAGDFFADGVPGKNMPEIHDIIDITRELLSAEVYPGDPAPSMEAVLRLSAGDPCSVSRLTIGTHTGTHMDAPSHFIEGGCDISEIPPEKYIGKCIVADWDTFASKDLPEDCERLLIKGAQELTEEQARYAVEFGIKLIGVELPSVGGETVHDLLLGEETVLIESIDLSCVSAGKYTLFCASLKIEGADGAPCRAFLIPM